MLRLGFDPVKSRPAAAECKTRRWLDGFTDIVRAVREVGGKTRVLSVCDREADCFELFDAQRRSPRVDLLVRAHHDRILGKRQPKLFATMSAGTPDARIEVEVDGLTARPKSSRKKARPARRKRLASCELRFRRVTLPATQALQGAEPVNVCAVHVVETHPPPDEDPIQWFLLTTLEVRTASQAGDEWLDGGEHLVLVIGWCPAIKPAQPARRGVAHTLVRRNPCGATGASMT